MKVKQFIKEHKMEVAVAVGSAAVVAIYGLTTGYKVGRQVELDSSIAKFGQGAKIVNDAAKASNNLYVNTLDKAKTVKFKDLGELVKQAVDFDPKHLEDDVIGLFVMTKSEN